MRDFRILVAAFGAALCLAGCNPREIGNNDSASGTIDIADPVLRHQLTTLGFTQATAVGDKVLITGAEYVSSKTVDVYDTISQSWSSAELSEPRHAMGVGVIQNRAYFVGGISAFAQQYDVIDIFDADTLSWSVANLATARASAGVAAVGTKLVVAGGFNAQSGPNVVPHGGRNAQNSIEIFDEATGTHNFAALSWPRTGLASTTVGSKAYFIGGRACTFEYVEDCDPVDTIDIYDGDLDSVSTISMPHARECASAATVGTKIVVAGGRNAEGLVSAVDVLETTTGIWSSYPAPAMGCGSRAVSNGTQVAIAGSEIPNNDTVLIFDGGTVDATRSLSSRRYNIFGFALGDRFYFGGGSGTLLKNTLRIEAIDP